MSDLPRILLVLLSAALAAMPVLAAGGASGSPSADSLRCIDAARVAASRHGVPERVIRAIAVVESRRPDGRGAKPWPWTLNVAGQGLWFDDRATALAHAREVIANGEPLVDLGCFQINHRWHGAAFASLDEMLDPLRSADYAARFLQALYGETGNWLTAAGLYHSRRPKDSARYRRLVAEAMGAMPEAGLWAPLPVARWGELAPGAGSLWPTAGPRSRVGVPPGGVGTGGLRSAVGAGMLRRAGGRLVDIGS